MPPYKGEDEDDLPPSADDQNEHEARVALGLAGVPDDEMTDDARAAVADLAKQSGR